MRQPKNRRVSQKKAKDGKEIQRQENGEEIRRIRRELQRSVGREESTSKGERDTVWAERIRRRDDRGEKVRAVKGS